MPVMDNQPTTEVANNVTTWSITVINSEGTVTNDGGSPDDLTLQEVVQRLFPGETNA